MRQIASLLILMLLMTSLTGCLIRTRSHRQGQSRARSCPPSSHWNGNQCVHNGRGRGRGHGPPIRDHRR